MSSCMSGGGRAYRLESLDLELIKSPSTSWVSNSSSPSSTLSESSNCPLAISTRKRKPRTPRKRPNQTYNEAAAILSTAYPKIFPTKHLSKTCKFTKSRVADDDDDVDNKNPALLFEPSDLLMPFDGSSGLILLEPPLLQKPPNFAIEPKGFINPCQSPGEINSSEEDFDAESMLDEEIGEGIDSIMGNLENESMEEDPTSSYYYSSPCTQMNNNNNNNNKICSYGYPVLGLGFDQFFGYGMRRELRAMRNGDECDWWRFPSVNVLDLTPKIEKKKKKVSSAEINNSEENLAPKTPTTDGSTPQPNAGLLLKLNYDSVLNAWSDKGSPFSGDSQAGNDVQARLAQIDLFSENGGIREASVQRYKEKRRTRLFSKKIRYQVRKVNADRRPRMKGRFVRTPNSCDD